jgi:hypothetical protein
MKRLSVLGFVLLLTTPALAEQAVTVGSFSVVGMEDADAAQIREKIEAELSGKGMVVKQSSEEIDAMCWEEPECLQRQAKTLGVSGFLRVNVLRAGSLVQISAELFNADGSLMREGQQMVSSDEVATAETLLGADVRGALESLPEAPAAGGDDAEEEGGGGDEGAGEEGEEGGEELGGGEDGPGGEEGGGMNTLGVVGAATAGVGALALAGGVTLALVEDAVLRDPASESPDKESAIVLGYTGIGVAAAGAAAAIAGGAIAYTGFASE